ncbi:MAG TPA: sigma-70 family RNA polymerase sigma factor [Candidatus Dormibacteraeota bacterium]|nr:sigma-70 family RNA polymerase sigma factor [Candidatus Dormibacteraeota bacterium]
MILSQALTPISVEADYPRSADEVVARYWEQAYRFAAMVAPTAHESQDIAQEALIVVVRRLTSFDPRRGAFDAWLWRIVLNIARDSGRASVRRASLWERLERDHRVVEDADVEDIVVRRLDDTRLLGAVHSLKPRPRTLVALRFGAQLSYPEIGAQLGISEAAAIMATRRALATLRTKLEESS